jgi:hypothetical protein
MVVDEAVSVAVVRVVEVVEGAFVHHRFVLVFQKEKTLMEDPQSMF